MKKVAKYFSFLLIIISFFSCRESSVTPEEPTNTNLKLRKILSDSKPVFVYKYENEKVISFDIYIKDTVSGTIRFYYDGNNNLIKYEDFDKNSSSIIEYSLYDYDVNGRMSGEKDYQLKSNGVYALENFNFYECDKEGRVIKSTNAITNQVTCTVIYDNSGNVTEINSFKDGQLAAKETFEYDSGMNPQKDAVPYTILAAQVTSKNNVIRDSYVAFLSGQKEERTIYSKFEYNTKNYPINCSYSVTQVVENDNFNSSGHIEYEYY